MSGHQAKRSQLHPRKSQIVPADPAPTLSLLESPAGHTGPRCRLSGLRCTFQIRMRATWSGREGPTARSRKLDHDRARQEKFPRTSSTPRLTQACRKAKSGGHARALPGKGSGSTNLHAPNARGLNVAGAPQASSRTESPEIRKDPRTTYQKDILGYQCDRGCLQAKQSPARVTCVEGNLDPTSRSAPATRH